MSNTFLMTSHILENDLFINLSGVFDGSSAWEPVDVKQVVAYTFKKMIHFLHHKNIVSDRNIFPCPPTGFWVPILGHGKMSLFLL